VRRRPLAAAAAAAALVVALGFSFSRFRHETAALSVRSMAVLPLASEGAAADQG
jgi:hypothetical protein